MIIDIFLHVAIIPGMLMSIPVSIVECAYTVLGHRYDILWPCYRVEEWRRRAVDAGEIRRQSLLSSCSFTHAGDNLGIEFLYARLSIHTCLLLEYVSIDAGTVGRGRDKEHLWRDVHHNCKLCFSCCAGQPVVFAFLCFISKQKGGTTCTK